MVGTSNDMQYEAPTLLHVLTLWTTRSGPLCPDMLATTDHLHQVIGRTGCISPRHHWMPWITALSWGYVRWFQHADLQRHVPLHPDSEGDHGVHSTFWTKTISSFPVALKPTCGLLALGCSVSLPEPYQLTQRQGHWLLSILHEVQRFQSDCPQQQKKVENYMECPHAMNDPFKTSHCWGRPDFKRHCINCWISHNDHRRFILHVM